MNLRTKLIVSIGAFMLLVCALLALNIVLDAAARERVEHHRRAELVATVVGDWVRATQELRGWPDWAALRWRLDGSTLVEGWLFASQRAGTGAASVVLEDAQPPLKELGVEEEKRLREVFDNHRIVVIGRRVYAPVGDPGRTYAMRLDLRLPEEPAPAIGSGLTTLIAVMAIGTVLLILNAYVFLNRFVLRPLEALVETSRRVSEGDFSKKVPERPTYDEMAALVGAFNLMIDRIARQQAGLMDDVQQARQRITRTEKRLFAAQRLSATGTLAAGIAHEINNPLGGMLNAARALRAGGLTEGKRAEYLELIADGLERVRAIVQKVLQFRPKELEPQPVSLRDVVAKAASFLEHRAREKGVEIRNEVGGDLPLVYGDPLELQQAFLNVLMNAVDACAPGEGRVTAAHALEDSEVTVRVEDNGCGMDEQDLARCMDLFFTTKDAGEGTGLGLSVAQNIVRNHGGRIDIRSEKGKGTVVAISLPVAPPSHGDTGTR